MSTTTTGFSFTILNATSITGFVVSNFNAPIFTGSFSNQAFWEAFIKKNNIKDEEELVAKILDIARSHFGPDAKNWPGMTIVVTHGSGTWNIVLPAGKTICQETKRGQGNYSWTSMCLATAAVFEQVFRQSDKVNTSVINGNWNGATQYQTTLQGFTAVHYQNCQTSLTTWLTSVGQPARTPIVTLRVTNAALQTIASRTEANCAWNIANIARFLSGAPVLTGTTNTVTFVETEATYVP